MAKQLDPKDLVTLEELAISNMWETSALVELLERKGILTKQDVLDMIHELRQREPTGHPATPDRDVSAWRYTACAPKGISGRVG